MLRPAPCVERAARRAVAAGRDGEREVGARGRRPRRRPPRPRRRPASAHLEQRAALGCAAAPSSCCPPRATCRRRTTRACAACRVPRRPRARCRCRRAAPTAARARARRPLGGRARAPALARPAPPRPMPCLFAPQTHTAPAARRDAVRRARARAERDDLEPPERAARAVAPRASGPWAPPSSASPRPRPGACAAQSAEPASTSVVSPRVAARASPRAPAPARGRRRGRRDDDDAAAAPGAPARARPRGQRAPGMRLAIPPISRLASKPPPGLGRRSHCARLARDVHGVLRLQRHGEGRTRVRDTATR